MCHREEFGEQLDSGTSSSCAIVEVCDSVIQ